MEIPVNMEIPAQPRFRIIRASVAILALVAAMSLAQRIHAVSHRYDQFDFNHFYGWWSDYSSGGDPWTDRRGPMRGCNYPPAFVEIFSPLARLDPKTAFRIWQAAMVLCVAAAVLLLAHGNASPLGPGPTIIVLSLVLLSRPFAGSLVWSQVAPMLLALLSAAWFFAQREQQAAAGLCVALAALLKLYPAGAAGYFLFGRRWRALGWTIGFFAAGVLLTNPGLWLELVTWGLPLTYHVRGGRAGVTVLPFVRSSLAHFAGIRIAAEPILAVWGFTALLDLALLAIAGAATITSRARTDLDGLRFGLWVALALLMSPLAWETDTLLLLPAYLFGLRAAWDGDQPREAAWRIGLIAGATMLAICLASTLIKALPHPGFPVLLGAYLGAALIFRVRIRSELPR
jgi:hypothetical protein